MIAPALWCIAGAFWMRVFLDAEHPDDKGVATLACILCSFMCGFACWGAL